MMDIASLMNGFESPGRNGHPDLKKRWQNPVTTDVPLFLNGQNDFNATSSRFLFKNNYIQIEDSTWDTLLMKFGWKSIRYKA